MPDDSSPATPGNFLSVLDELERLLNLDEKGDALVLIQGARRQLQAAVPLNDDVLILTGHEADLRHAFSRCVTRTVAISEGEQEEMERRFIAMVKRHSRAHPPSADEKKASGETEETRKLRNTVKFLDNVSQDAFSEISAVAHMALQALEQPTTYRNPEDIAHAFQLIRGRAEDAENIINSAAEDVGCHWTNEATRRRLSAWNKASEPATTP